MFLKEIILRVPYFNSRYIINQFHDIIHKLDPKNYDTGEVILK